MPKERMKRGRKSTEFLGMPNIVLLITGAVFLGFAFFMVLGGWEIILATNIAVSTAWFPIVGWIIMAMGIIFIVIAFFMSGKRR